MTSIHIELTGDRQAGLRFAEFPSALRDDLRAEIDSISDELFGRIQAQIPGKSGELRSRLTNRLFDKEDRVTAYIAINAQDQSEHRKAAALEYGSRGKKIEIKPHKMRLDHYWSEKLAAPRTVIVEAYSRLPRIAEHKFLRGPLEAMRPQINSRLKAVVEGAVKDANA